MAQKKLLQKKKPTAKKKTKKAVAKKKGGLRFDAGKTLYSLLPPEAIEALARHYTENQKKYPARNWEKGMDWDKVWDPLMRHAMKWQMGEDLDDDPKLPEYKAHHMIAVAWNAIALYTYHMRKIGKDTRVATHPEIIDQQ